VRAQQLDDKLKGEKKAGKWICPPEPWQQVAEFAAYCSQMKTLRLKPWESPPCWSDGKGNDPKDKLCRKMLKAGISKFHLVPLAALEEATAEARRPTPPPRAIAAHRCD
jgi:hypothetical protein